VRLERVLNGVEETEKMAAALALVLRPGDVIALSGGLGAGKTTLVRALAGALGIDVGMVSSPTYVIVNQYPNMRDGSMRMAHVDAYRLSGEEDLDALGWDLLTDGSWILAIEWPEKIGEAHGAIGPDTLRVRLAHVGDGVEGEARRVTLEIPDVWAVRPELASLARAMRREAPCPITGEVVAPDSPTYPFSSERARLADLNRWFTGERMIPRPITDDDLANG
jgi:tRNA threonylcarbamoyladenosine biosynthesis protein TsaE